MTAPLEREPKFFEHERYAEFLATRDHSFGLLRDFEKRMVFGYWLKDQEAKEDAADFKNLVPMHIRMNEEEWDWFVAKLEDENDPDRHLPNLKALAKHPPAGFKDLH